VDREEGWVAQSFATRDTETRAWAVCGCGTAEVMSGRDIERGESGVQNNSNFAGNNLSASDMNITNSVTLSSPHNITDNDFTNPERNVILPTLSDNTLAAIGSKAKPVLIKRTIFEKNKVHHPEITPSDSRKILYAALNAPDLTINDKPTAKANYWVLVKVGNKNAVVTIDADTQKTNIEVVGWRWASEKSVEQIKNRAKREGGQVLITTQGAAGLSALPYGSPIDKGSKNKSTTKSFESTKAEPIAVIKQAELETDTNPTEAQKKAGNYRKGHVRIQGLIFLLNNPKVASAKALTKMAMRGKQQCTTPTAILATPKAKTETTLMCFSATIR
jgi:hypothetical protein